MADIYDKFAEMHAEQLTAIAFPPELVKRLYDKLINETFDSGGAFQVVEDEESGHRYLSCLGPLEANSDVFLIDHAWTFDVEAYRNELREKPELLERMAAMMACREPRQQQTTEDEEEEEEGEDDEAGEGEAEEVVSVDEETLPRVTPDWSKPVYDQVCEEVWRYAQPYRLVDPRDPFRFKTLWFVMDELGSAVSHSPDPSFRVFPLVFMPQGTLRSAISYSLMWPVKSVGVGDLCTRDLLAGVGAGQHNTQQRLARLALWFRLPRTVMESFRRRSERRKSARSSKQQPPKELHLHEKKEEEGGGSRKGAARKDFNGVEHFTTRFLRRVKSQGGKLRIYTDNAQILEHLTRPEFVHVSSPAEADICWVYHSNITQEGYREEHGLTVDAVLGQSRGDECLVFKHRLPDTAARAPGSHRWIPQTWNLETEAAEVVWEFEDRRRRRNQKDTSWFILKPWNMGRSMDSVVTDSLAQVLRYMETGPKVCSEYIDRPALILGGRKFDLRVRVVVRSWRPLELLRWTHVGCRLANKPYSLDKQQLGDFQTHFTVMEYAGHEVEVPTEADFLSAFEKDHGAPFSVVDAKIDVMLKELFTAAAEVMEEEHGHGPELDACASTYGVDVIVTADGLDPKLLEVTFAPDCHRALEEDPQYYDKAFGSLFLGESRDFALL